MSKPVPFKPGDIVTLKSGSCRMTVEKSNPTQPIPTAECVWFNRESNQLQRAVLPFAALHLVPAKVPELDVEPVAETAAAEPVA